MLYKMVSYGFFVNVKCTDIKMVDFVVIRNLNRIDSLDFRCFKPSGIILFAKAKPSDDIVILTSKRENFSIVYSF